MSPEFVTGFLYETLKMTLLLAAPMLLAGLLAGVVISIFQAATQINEMTLVFIPKMIAVAAALLVFFPWMLQMVVTFTETLLLNIPGYIR